LTIPLFTYWHQGEALAPGLVKTCLRNLRALHSGYDIHVLDAESVGAWIEPIPVPEDKFRRLWIAHQSDLIRTQLLLRYGGVWVDPTVFMVRPLDEWLPQCMDSGLFLFHRPGRDRLISNWFIAAERENVLLRRLYERLCRYWAENEFDNLEQPQSAVAEFVACVLNRNLFLPRLWLRKPMIRLLRTAPYMVYHYQFADLVARDRACREIWRRTPKISADGPHRLLKYGLLSPLSPEVREWIGGADPPLFKLSWKLEADEIPADSVLGYLYASRP
jgi:hypothetical protein